MSSPRVLDPIPFVSFQRVEHITYQRRETECNIAVGRLAYDELVEDSHAPVVLLFLEAHGCETVGGSRDECVEASHL